MSFQELKEKLLAINPPLNKVDEVVKLILGYTKDNLILNEEETNWKCMNQRARVRATTNQICNALFRVGNYKLEDAIANLDRLKMQYLKSRNRFNEDLELRIEKQEQYIDRLLSCNKFKKKR